jgi:transposase-like protein
MEPVTIDLRDETACYNVLVELFHPGGLACPRCKEWEQLTVHRRHRAPVLDYRCSHCGRVFNAWTVTPVQKTHHPPSELVQLIKAIVLKQSTAHLARELGCQSSPLRQWRSRLQRHGLARIAKDLSEEVLLGTSGERATPVGTPKG